jgi:hypothetical protein
MADQARTIQIPLEQIRNSRPPPFLSRTVLTPGNGWDSWKLWCEDARMELTAARLGWAR